MQGVSENGLLKPDVLIRIFQFVPSTQYQVVAGVSREWRGLVAEAANKTAREIMTDLGLQVEGVSAKSLKAQLVRSSFVRGAGRNQLELRYPNCPKEITQIIEFKHLRMMIGDEEKVVGIWMGRIAKGGFYDWALEEIKSLKSPLFADQARGLVGKYTSKYDSEKGVAIVNQIQGDVLRIPFLREVALVCARKGEVERVQDLFRKLLLGAQNLNGGSGTDRKIFKELVAHNAPAIADQFRWRLVQGEKQVEYMCMLARSYCNREEHEKALALATESFYHGRLVKNIVACDYFRKGRDDEAKRLLKGTQHLANVDDQLEELAQELFSEEKFEGAQWFAELIRDEVRQDQLLTTLANRAVKKDEYEVAHRLLQQLNLVFSDAVPEILEMVLIAGAKGRITDALKFIAFLEMLGCKDHGLPIEKTRDGYSIGEGFTKWCQDRQTGYLDRKLLEAIDKAKVGDFQPIISLKNGRGIIYDVDYVNPLLGLAATKERLQEFDRFTLVLVHLIVFNHLDRAQELLAKTPDRDMQIQLACQLIYPQYPEKALEIALQVNDLSIKRGVIGSFLDSFKSIVNERVIEEASHLELYAAIAKHALRNGDFDRFETAMKNEILLCPVPGAEDEYLGTAALKAAFLGDIERTFAYINQISNTDRRQEAVENGIKYFGGK
ncbi:MAG: hypothetical protein S4CHLAM102_08140 [Chlamydiia bacterium]|nr:hypothetical protein [Chlamydiia bacterium]